MAAPEAAISIGSREKPLTLISIFSSARLLSEIFLFIRGLSLAVVFGPHVMGVWTQMKLVLIFFPYSHLGTNDAMAREVPRAVGKGDLPRADRIKRTSLGFNLLISSCLALLFVSYLLVHKGGVDISFRTEWMLLPAVLMLNQMLHYVIVRLQAENNIGRSGVLILGFSCVSTIAGIAAAKYIGLAGFIVVVGLSCVAMLYWGEGISYCRHPVLDFSVIPGLIRTGFPIMMSTAMLILLWNIDKIVISYLMSARDLGIYAFQSSIMGVLMIVPHAVGTVFYPKIMENIGRSIDKDMLEKYLVLPTLTMSYLIIPILGIIFLTVHLPIRWLLPQYALSIVPGQICVFGVFFMVMAKMPVTLLVSLNKQNILLVLAAVSVLSGFAADVFFIRYGYGLVGVAAGTAMSFGVYAVLAIFYCIKTIDLPFARTGSFLYLAFLPYVFTCIACMAIQYCLPGDITDWKKDLMDTSIGNGVIIASTSILYFRLNKRYGVLSNIFGDGKWSAA